MKNITFVLIIFIFAIDHKWYKLAYRLTSFTYRKSNDIERFKLWADFAQHVNARYVSRRYQTDYLQTARVLINEKDYDINVIKQMAAYVSIGARRWYVVPNSLTQVTANSPDDVS